MYVWVDALSNYITALGYPEMGGEMTRWPADIHIIGKDITRFHAIYWPAFLMSANLALPKRIFGHGFIYNRGEKMSKSVGNVIAPQDLIATYGLDPIRYFLLREVAFGQDGNISHEALVQRMNSDLANGTARVELHQQERRSRRADARHVAAGRRGAAQSRAGSSAGRTPGICRAGLPSRARSDLAGHRRKRSLRR
jgi:methionyl-tRNA synthetase